VTELITKLESLTAEKIAREKGLIEMDLELTRLKKRLEKEEKDRKKEKTRLSTRNEELEGVFEENEGLKSLFVPLQEELATVKKSEQVLYLQVLIYYPQLLDRSEGRNILISFLWFVM